MHLGDQPGFARLSQGKITDSERCLATVMFSDLSGYTAINEMYDPEEVRRIVGRIFRHAAEVVGKYDGRIEKYVGDAVMAVFGFPHIHEDDPVRAIRAARELHQFVEGMSLEFEEEAGRSLSMHTGINTGLVVTGTPHETGSALGVVGDTVNVAARLCDLAESGQILVGNETRTLVDRYFQFEELANTRLKGKSETVQVHKVIAPRPRPSATRRAGGLRAGLIGRNEEFAILERAVEHLRDGTSTVLSLRGEAGSGKSRLIDEFRASLPLDGINWFAGNAYDHSRGIPYYPVIDLLSRAWGIEEADPPHRVREKIESRIRGLLDDPESAIPFVGGLFALDYPELIGVNPEYWAQRLYSALLAIFEAVAAQGPTIFLFEDLHWADPSTLELLRRVLTHMCKPAAMLCTYRPTFALFSPSEAEKVSGYREIELKSLSMSQTEELVIALLMRASAPLELIRFTQEQTEGNPFYVEEVLTSLIESRVLTCENDSWRLTGSLDAFHVPATVQEVIAARVSRLEGSNRRLLQEASVIGRSFLYKLLGRIASGAENLHQRLNALEQADLIHGLAQAPDLEYRFKHALTQEVVYHSLLKSEREAIHERVAQVMEELLKDRLPELYETLAFHYKHGRSLHKAVDYLIKSGEKAVNRFALDEAHRYYQEAYDIVSLRSEKTAPEIEQLFDLLDKWAIVFYYFGTFGALSELLRRHEPLAEALQNKARRGMFAAWIGCTLYFRLQPQEAYRYLKQALALGEQAAERRVIGYACTWLAMTCASLSRYEDGIANGERAHEIAQGMPEDHYLHFKSLAMIAFNYTAMGDAAKTLALGRRLLEYGEQHSNPRSLLWGHQTIGRGLSNAGDLPAAIRSLEKAIQVSKDPFYLFSVQAEHGMYQVIAGHDPLTLRDVRDRLASQGVEVIADRLGIVLGFGQLVHGRMADGMKIVEGCSRRSADGGSRLLLHLSEHMKGKIYLQMVIGPRPRLAVLLRNLGFLLTHRPFAERRARVLLGQVEQFYADVGAYGLRAQALLGLGLLHKTKKRKEKARACLAEAAALFERAGAEGFLQQARNGLAQLR
jgi:class 3 adenylate cyclase/tetratricopeptide (TPR) repeat protein